MIEQDFPHGTFNLVTGEEARSAVLAQQGTSQGFTGTNAELDAAADAVEASGNSYAWEETATTFMPAASRPDAMGPAELQITSLEREDFDALLTPAHVGKLFYTLGYLGIASYGDVLALGSDAIVGQSATVLNSKIGERTLGYLRAAVLRRTGHNLSEHRATPAEQLDYFEDIKAASVALGLPFGRLENFGQTCLPRGHRTIGSVAFLTRPEFERVLKWAGKDVDKGAIHRFVGSLPSRVVAPFERAKDPQ